MGTSYNTQTPPVLSKINKEKNYNYKASHSPWENKKPLLTSCSLHIHILYIIISFFREAKHICLPDTGYQLSVRVFLHQEGNCKCWAQMYFWFMLQKTTKYSFYTYSTQANIRSVFDIISLNYQYNLAQIPILSTAPQGVPIMIGAINKEKMHVNYWKAVLQEELVSLVSLPCCMELQRQHDT